MENWPLISYLLTTDVHSTFDVFTLILDAS